jgi:glycosyltransferase involved in cell wall biosynthesis
MTNMTDLAVVIPAYGVAGCLGETIDAVLAQTLPPAEVVVFVDASSPDQTLAVARGYAPDVTVVEHQPTTSMNARHLAVQATTSPLVAPCDGDDVWLPTKLERQVAELRTNPALDGVFCAVTEFTTETGGGPALRRGHERIDGRVASALLVRRGPLEGIGGFTSGDHLAHWIEWLSVAVHRGLHLGHVDEVLVRRRLRSDGYTSRHRDQTGDMIATMRAHLSRRREVRPA